MEEIQKELNHNLPKGDKFKLFFRNNFNPKVMMRRTQKFGGWLSAMIMPIIGVIIGWGLLTAFFIPDGWTPVKAINEYIIGNMISYLIPILIGYHGGKIVHGGRGGVVGAFVVFGVIVGNQHNPGWWDGAAPTPQFLGAMIVAPIASGILKGFDKLIEGKIKSGFEMLVNNFSMGILGALMVVGTFYGMPWVINGVQYTFMTIVDGLVSAKLTFLSALVVEPAKILFLNNAINHGVFTPIGLEQVAGEAGKSILFLLESNPGPAVGMLIAITIFDKKLRGQAGGASLIQFFGGIHEVYFPFALMRPAFLLSLIGAGLVGDAVFQIFDAGLIAPASPGSIIAVFAMTESSASNYGAVAGGVIAAAGTSFGISTLIFLINGKKYKKQNQEALDAARLKTVELKGKESKFIKTTANSKLIALPKLIIFACEAGMGSSAMGAGLLRKKIKAANLNIDVKNYPIKELPSDAEFVITQQALTDLAKTKVPSAIHRSIANFLDNDFYEKIVQEMREL